MARFVPPTLAEVAEDVAEAHGDESRQWALLINFVELFRHETGGVQTVLLHEPPNTTGDRRWDVFVAGLAEWEAEQFNLPIPAWTFRNEELVEPWFVNELASQRREALISSPEPFRKRQVYIRPFDLSVA